MPNAVTNPVQNDRIAVATGGQTPSTNAEGMLLICSGFFPDDEVQAYLEARGAGSLAQTLADEAAEPERAAATGAPAAAPSGQPTRWSAAPSLDDVKAGRATIEGGQEGEAVKSAQQRLESLGFKETRFGADGKHGKYSTENVRAFQAKHGLDETGAFDAATLRKMSELEAAGPAKPAPVRQSPAANVARAPSTKPAAKTEPRAVSAVERDIAGKKAEIGALAGSADPAAQRRRTQEVTRLEAEQKTLRASPEYKAVSDLREKKAELKAAEEDRSVLPSTAEREQQVAKIRSLRGEVAAGEKKVASFKSRVEADERRIEGDLAAFTSMRSHHFDARIGRLQGEQAALEKELHANPGYQRVLDYRSNKAELSRLKSEPQFMPTGKQIEARQAQIDSLEKAVKDFEAQGAI